MVAEHFMVRPSGLFRVITNIENYKPFLDILVGLLGRGSAQSQGQRNMGGGGGNLSNECITKVSELSHNEITTTKINTR
jgi:hypothetical protein